MDARIKAILADRRKTALNRVATDSERAMSLPDFRETELALRKLNYETAVLGADRGKERAMLLDRKQKLIDKYGLALDPPFSCAVCGDTGYLRDGSLCSCAKRLLSEQFKKQMRLSDRTDVSFDNTDFSVFGDAADDYRKYYEKMRQFCDRFDTTKVRNILLLGDVGTGKTYLTACVLDRMIELERTAIFLTAFDFGRVCLAHHTERDRADLLEAVLDVDLLVLDDLGTEPVYRNVTLEYLYSVLNERLRREKKTLITSNLSLRDVFDRYGERIASRLNNKATCLTLHLKGKDLRRKGL